MKCDVEYRKCAFLGLGHEGVEVLVGTPDGTMHTQDVQGSKKAADS